MVPGAGQDDEANKDELKESKKKEATEEYRRMGINLRVIVPRKRATQAPTPEGIYGLDKK